MTYTTKPLILSVAILTMVFAISTTTVFADHADTGMSWSEDDQELFCHSNLSSLSITNTVTDDLCDDIITDAAADWTNVSNSDWELTVSGSSAIDLKSANLGASGNVGKTTSWGLFGTIWGAYIEFNTNSDFGDSTSDSNVYDIYTIVKHEIGHLPTMTHNAHSGEQSTSVMRTGSEIGYNDQRSISSSDASELAGKY